MIWWSGATKLNDDGRWTIRESALCVCGVASTAQDTFPQDISERDRVSLVRRVMKAARDRAQECYDSHHGEYGLDAIDGSI